MNFINVKDLKSAVTYLEQQIDKHEYIFDGFERMPIKKTIEDPLNRVYQEPRYNWQTVLFISRFADLTSAELVLWEAVHAADSFKQHDGYFVLLSKIGNVDLFIKVYFNEDDGREMPIVIFHEGFKRG